MKPVGFVRLFPDEGEDDGPRQYIADRDRFTFSVPAGGTGPARSLCLVGFADESSQSPEPQIEYMALQRRGGKTTSFDRRMTLEFFHEISPLPTSALRDALPKRLQRYFAEGEIPPATWAATLQALAELRPSTVETLAALRVALAPPAWFLSETAATVALERDAVRLAASLAGVDRTQAENRTPLGQPAPFLRSLESARVREDSVIQHDAEVFGDWDLISRHQVGAAEFSNRRGDRLTVINVNRHTIEETLGVDLLYYTHAFHAFVLVQYKSLRSEKSGQFVYRPRSDSSLDREVTRMRRAQWPSSWAGDPPGYRLDSSPFYFKFCRNVTFDPFSTAMVKGMYLPLSYWDALSAASAMPGPRGGVIVSFESVPRFLTNESFVRLVEDGWVGSRDSASDAISAIVAAGLADGHSLVLATHTPPTTSNGAL